MIGHTAIALSALVAAGSIVVDSRRADSVEIRGVGCGLPGSATIALYYGRITFFAAQRARFMKKGDLYTYSHPGCQSAKPKPV